MKKLFITTTFLIISFAFAITIANAQGLNDASSVFKDIGGKAGASTYENPEDVIGIGIGVAITLVGMIFLVLMVYAGYLWMTARGEQEQVDKAQKIITTALIGFFIVASAYAITKFVSGKLGEQTPESTQETYTQAGCAFDATKAANYCGKIKEANSEECDQQIIDGQVLCDWSTFGGGKCEVEVDVVADLCDSFDKTDCQGNGSSICKWVE